MLHNFRKSLQHEREQTLKADRFYIDVLHASFIKRFNTDSEEDMCMQRQDVDVLITVNGTTFKVSEKFRDVDYGDLYIEIYSKYPDTLGWMHTGSPNAILYFTPRSVYWITHSSLKYFCINELFNAIPTQWLAELYENKKTIQHKKITIKDSIVDLHLIQSHNKDGASWETIGVSVAFDVLKSFGVKFLKIDVV